MRKTNNSPIRTAKMQFQAASSVAEKKKKTPSPITLRLTDEERTKLKLISAGMTISAYIRKCIFGGDVVRGRRRTHTPVKDQEAMARALGLLGQSRIPNNLNQLAYHANTGTLLVDDETKSKLDEAYTHVRFIRTELIRALGLFENSRT